jgi:hypothetical protein
MTNVSKENEKEKLVPYSMIISSFLLSESKDSAVGIVTGYGLDSRGVRVQVPVGA